MNIGMADRTGFEPDADLAVTRGCELDLFDSQRFCEFSANGGFQIDSSPEDSDDRLFQAELTIVFTAKQVKNADLQSGLSTGCVSRESSERESKPMNVRAGLGLTSFPFDHPRDFFRWAQLCEQHRVDSLWQSDRLMSQQAHLESMSAMAALAGVTEHIRFGMNVLVAPLRDPLVLAKQCATVDFLSGGRLLPAFGVGLDKALEWQATGRDPKQRGTLANEILELISRLWHEEKVTFQGQHFVYRDVSILPRPLQKRFPLWIGGHSPAAIRRTARIGTGWIGGIISAQQTGEVIRAIRRELVETGRSIDDDHYGATIAFRIGSWDEPVVERYPLLRRPGRDPREVRPLLCVGDSRQLIERIGAYKREGASKFVLFPIAQGTGDVFDQTLRVINDVLPAVETG
jgi:probable F420-dependent oxidoreductase